MDMEYKGKELATQSGRGGNYKFLVWNPLECGVRSYSWFSVKTFA